MQSSLVQSDERTEPVEESQTAAAMQALALYATRPGEDDPDYRPLPDDQVCRDAFERIAGDVTEMFTGTRLEDEIETVMWGVVHIMHRKVMRLDRDIDRNMVAQQRSQREQDFSEVKDLELQRLIAEGQTFEETQNVFTALREIAAELFETQTGSVWTPPSGSRVSQTATTAAMLDSRKFVAERKRRKSAEAAPDGEVVLFSGGTECQDREAIWAVLDKTYAKYPQMILATTAWLKGADHIAALWARARNVHIVPFRPDTARWGKRRAPFKRNDEMLKIDNIVGVLIFPGQGVTLNLRDKAREKGLIVVEYGAS